MYRISQYDADHHFPDNISLFFEMGGNNGQHCTLKVLKEGEKGRPDTASRAKTLQAVLDFAEVV
jgi:hypothetical protein